ncbi:MFS transporter (plasmid) [Aliirhizobium terrae]|uniref:MFS transporter n=1 Tax=Terrirhizobium terrae TaxID=2926709 RepID=UPI0025764648|nr:MFS transporter [Rhizobium sp. CC-CFT758]WJH38377.1 MFS transporter [Rhizobium sp. CC-CFT758]
MVAAAFSLTALTYGLARFAYGLLLPSIRADLNLSATASGWIGSVAFASYCLGVILAFTLVERLGERRICVFAGLSAAGAMTIAAVSSSGWHIGFAMAIGGLSTGLTSPPLASAVERAMQQSAQARANGVINAGTAVGIVISGAAAIAFAGNWRELYAGFACLGLLTAFWLWWAMPLTTVEDTLCFLVGVTFAQPARSASSRARFLLGLAARLCGRLALTS